MSEQDVSPEIVKDGPVVAILDAGAQYGGLIDRVVWEYGVRTELLPLNTPFEELEQYGAIIITGGPDSVNDPSSPDCDPRIFNGVKPVLGICYGMQLMAKHCGGIIEPTGGHDSVVNTWVFRESLLYKDLDASQDVLLTHNDAVTIQPSGFTVSAGTHDTITGIENSAKKLYATQYHPEVRRTKNGDRILRNFIHEVAGIEPYIDVKDLEAEAINYIQEYLGDRDVMLFVSGGVDSAVLAKLVSKAVDPSRIHAFHVDHGLMREHESDDVFAELRDAGIDVNVINAEEHYFTFTTTDKKGNPLPPLSEVTEPEHKRLIIGDAFIALRDKIIKDFGLDPNIVLAQGTLRPDLIESGSLMASISGHADTIKTHHNDTPAVRALRDENKVCEPLQNFYKDQVRQLGKNLGLPEEIYMRLPFPGPGLGIRILCTGSKIPQAIEAAPDIKRRFQGAARVLPLLTVGVQGDVRSYKPMVGVLSDFPEEVGPWEELRGLADEIPKDYQEVNRVTAVMPRDRDLWLAEPRYIPNQRVTRGTGGSVDFLRGADAIVNRSLAEHGIQWTVSQVPVILAHLAFSDYGQYSIGLRPFMTTDFMTGEPAIPGRDLPLELPRIIARRLFEYSSLIDSVIYDLSGKPPGTTEWE